MRSMYRHRKPLKNEVHEVLSVFLAYKVVQPCTRLRTPILRARTLERGPPSALAPTCADTWARTPIGASSCDAPRFISFTRFLFWAFYKDPFYTTWIFRYNFWGAAGNVWRWLCRHLRRKNLASMDREASDRSPVRRPGSKDSHRC